MIKPINSKSLRVFWNWIKDLPLFAVKDPRGHVCLIFAVTVLVFFNTFRNQPVINDFDFIVDWHLIQNLSHLPRFFVGFIPPDGHPGIYSPLKTLFYSFNYHLFGTQLIGYHVMALFIHLAATFAVYRLALLLVRNNYMAFLTGLFFGIHPVHVESVTYLSASVETIGMVFLFLSFFYYIKAAGDDGAVAVGYPQDVSGALSSDTSSYYRSLVFSLLAIFTHELAMSLPVLFLMYDLYFRRRGGGPGEPKKTLFLRLAPFFACVIIYAMTKWQVTGTVLTGRYLMESFYLTLMLMIKVVAKYILLLLFPFTLAINHVISPGIFSYYEKDFDEYAVLSQSLLEPQIMMSFIFIIGIIFLAVYLYRKQPLVSFCIGWFFVSLIPVFHVLPGEAYLAERNLYPGSFAFCLLLSYGLYQLYCQGRSSNGEAAGKTSRVLSWEGFEINKAEVSIILAVTLIGFYSVRTIWRNQDWKDQANLLQSSIRANPQSASLHNNLAMTLLQDGQPSKALTHFKKALALKSNEAQYYFDIESAYSALEQYTESEKMLLKAIEINPEFAEAYYNLAGLNAYLEKEEKANAYLRKTVEILKKQGRILEAGDYFILLKAYIELPRTIMEQHL